MSANSEKTTFQKIVEACEGCDHKKPEDSQFLCRVLRAEMTPEQASSEWERELQKRLLSIPVKTIINRGVSSLPYQQKEVSREDWKKPLDDDDEDEDYDEDSSADDPYDCSEGELFSEKVIALQRNAGISRVEAHTYIRKNFPDLPIIERNLANGLPWHHGLFDS